MDEEVCNAHARKHVVQGWKQSLSSPDSPAGQNLAKPDFGLTYSWIPGFWADFLDSYPGFHLDSYLDAAIPGL